MFTKPFDFLKKLLVECEVANIQEDFTVAIPKNRMIIGQLPRKICWYFLQKNGSKTTCIVSSHSESDSHTKKNDLI